MADNLTQVVGGSAVTQSTDNAEITSTTKAVYMMIWAADSPNPGYIDHGIYLDHHIPEHNFDEVVGPHRVFVEIDKGSDAWKVFVDPGSINPHDNPDDWRLVHLDINKCYYDWTNEKFVFVQTPPPTWDEVKAARDTMLAGSDNAFNFDTPEPLRSEWMFYREQLRQFVDNEKANGRTPGSVHWPIPPWPPSARRVGEHEVEPIAPPGMTVPDTHTPGMVMAQITTAVTPADNEIIIHRPANLEKYGKKCKGSAGGVDLDTDLMELAKAIREEVKACKGVPAQDITPTNHIVHIGDPANVAAQMAINTNTLGDPTGASANTASNPSSAVSGTPLTNSTAQTLPNGV